MVQQIVWTQKALQEHDAIVSYLFEHFGQRIVFKFSMDLKEKLVLIRSHPQLYVVTNSRKNIRKTVVNKRLVIFYRHSIRKRKIEIISLWDTRRNK